MPSAPLPLERRVSTTVARTSGLTAGTDRGSGVAGTAGAGSGLAFRIARLFAMKIEEIFDDTAEPSQFSHEILNANPYAYLDDAPLEERRTRAVPA